MTKEYLKGICKAAANAGIDPKAILRKAVSKPEKPDNSSTNAVQRVSGPVPSSVPPPVFSRALPVKPPAAAVPKLPEPNDKLAEAYLGGFSKVACSSVQTNKEHTMRKEVYEKFAEALGAVEKANRMQAVRTKVAEALGRRQAEKRAEAIYAEGFCKAAELAGVDPRELMKAADGVGVMPVNATANSVGQEAAALEHYGHLERFLDRYQREMGGRGDGGGYWRRAANGDVSREMRSLESAIDVPRLRAVKANPDVTKAVADNAARNAANARASSSGVSTSGRSDFYMGKYTDMSRFGSRAKPGILGRVGKLAPAVAAAAAAYSAPGRRLMSALGSFVGDKLYGIGTDGTVTPNRLNGGVK